MQKNYADDIEDPRFTQSHAGYTIAFLIVMMFFLMVLFGTGVLG